MITRRKLGQLVAFVVVSVVAVGYGSWHYLDLRSVVSPPFHVEVDLASSGGIYEGADVTVLGTSVGRVSEVRPGPDGGTVVELDLEQGTEVPRAVRADVRNRSAIGEQYVDLTPRRAGGPYLADGDRIDRASTHVPVDTSELLQSLGSLVESVPADDLRDSITELSTALDGLGPTIAQAIDSFADLSSTTRQHADELTQLIDQAEVVLGTQRDLGGQTKASLRALGHVTDDLAAHSDDLTALFEDGARGGRAVSDVLDDNREALRTALQRLLPLAGAIDERRVAVRKTLVMFPWAIEFAGTGIRHCGEYDARTGQPVEATCRYDADGNPVWSTYLGLQLPAGPGQKPYYPCTRGYEGTKKYLPNGEPLHGGARQSRDSAPNLEAGCTASPYDPSTPNVRGPQNVPGGGR